MYVHTPNSDGSHLRLVHRRGPLFPPGAGGLVFFFGTTTAGENRVEGGDTFIFSAKLDTPGGNPPRQTH